jgi:hypothetical protein
MVVETSPCDVNNGGCPSNKICLPGTSTGVSRRCVCSDGPHSSSSSCYIAAEQSFFVVAEVSAIHGRSLLEGSANKTRNVFDPITFTDDGPPPATDYNADANEIFWTSKSNRSILKASASGGPSSVLFQLEDGSYPTSLAVDWITGNIYYTTSRGQIAIVRGDGSYNAILIDQPSGNFSSLAVSPLTG